MRRERGTDVLYRARRFLVNTQGSDGGWGYRLGSQSVTEATALTVIVRPSERAAESGLSWLLRTQREDGGWGLHAEDDSSNWLTVWATWALLLSGRDDVMPAARRGVEWLLSVPVVRITRAEAVPDVMGVLGIDPSLAGWPWQPGEASFVEPTSLSLLALLSAGTASHPRLREALAYLRDRVCEEGGWNVGNPYMFRKPLPPTPYSTSVALLALRAGGANRKEMSVSRGLEALRVILNSRLRASTLAWGMAAMKVWRVNEIPLQERLLDMQADDGGWENSPYATACAVFALDSIDGLSTDWPAAFD